MGKNQMQESNVPKTVKEIFQDALWKLEVYDHRLIFTIGTDEISDKKTTLHSNSNKLSFFSRSRSFNFFFLFVPLHRTQQMIHRQWYITSYFFIPITSMSFFFCVCNCFIKPYINFIKIIIIKRVMCNHINLVWLKRSN